jgi:hypothetical protein
VRAELRDLVNEYKSQHERSVSAWSNTSGSITDNAARVQASDRLAEEAAQTLKDIEAACERHTLDANTVRALLQ